MGNIYSGKRLLIVRNLRIILIVLLYIQLQVVWTSSRCPVYHDPAWKSKDSACKDGKSYHCQNNAFGSGTMAVEGCFSVKTCRKGAHPVIEKQNDEVTCLECPKGSYQSNDGLRSNEYLYTACWPHDDCSPKHGYSECRPGTPESNTKCTCSEYFAPFPESCSCFTKDDGCGCIFLGCPNGTVLGGSTCISEAVSITTPSTVASTQESTVDTEQPPTNSALIAGIVAAVGLLAFVIIIGLIVYRCWHHNRESRHGNEPGFCLFNTFASLWRQYFKETPVSNGSIPPASESAEPLVNGGLSNGHTTCFSATDVLVQTDDQKPGKSVTYYNFNIKKATNVNILSTENGNCVTFDQDESSDKKETSLPSGSDVCSEEACHPPNQHIVDMDPSADTDAAPVITTGEVGEAGERVVVHDNGETTPKVVCDVPSGSFGESCETVPKTFLSGTNKQPCGNQETHDLEEPEETDSLLQGGERSEDEISIRTSVPISVNQERDETEHDVDIRLRRLVT